MVVEPPEGSAFIKAAAFIGDMQVELRFFATFRAAVGQKIIEREYADGATVGEVLEAVEEEFADLEGEILDDGGEIRPQLSILKNGKQVVHLEGTATTLADGDRLSLFPPVAGGATVEKAYRGISERLALHYLTESLGGERVGDHRVEADGWAAETSAAKVHIGTSALELTEVTVTFEGESLDGIVEAFSQKAMRAGG
jgi:MoaD family protein